MVTMRILVQFIGQIGAVMRLRQLKPDTERPFRMWLYPLPCLVALVGWMKNGLAVADRKDLHPFIRESQFNDFLDGRRIISQQ
jgi:hypothetical protein